MPGGSSPPPSWRRSPTFGSRCRTFVAEGNTVAARVAFRGTHRGEFQGIPPTDKEVAFSSMVSNHVVDGKVEENWVEIDLLRLLG
jgi:predicted ester cyclase